MVKTTIREVIDLDVNGRASAVVTFPTGEKAISFREIADLLESIGWITCYDPTTQRVIFEKETGGYWSAQYEEYMIQTERTSQDIREYLRELTWEELGKLFKTI